MPPEGYLPESSNDQTIEIQTANVADGSFAGEIQPVKMFIGFVDGCKNQLERIVALFQKVLADEPVDKAG